MEIEMKFGRETQTAGLGGWTVADVVKGKSPAEDTSEKRIVKDALAHPIDSAPLSQLVHAGQRVCFVLPDITRSWQHPERYLPALVAELHAGGVRDEDIVFLSGTGTHRAQTAKEHARLLGPELAKRFTVLDHDCQDAAAHQYLGTTSRGTPVEIDRRALACDHIVVCGAIVYHLLAGWSGGKKGLIPGISSYRTIMANHSLSLVPGLGNGVRPGVHSGCIDDNPVHSDMLEAAGFVRPSFLFNVVIGSDGRIAGAVAGNYVTAHTAGRGLVQRISGVPIPELGDAVIASAGGYPHDINLYQSIKLLINAQEAARSGGTIILVAECGEGVGGDAGLIRMITGFDSLTEREKFLRDDYTISKFVAYCFCASAQKYHLILVSRLKPDTLHGTGIEMAPTLEEAVRLARRYVGPEGRVVLMPDGTNTFPILTAAK